ncbi:hypothetical protein EBQ24_07755 [Allofranklinella schreckenbergeri]|uniref:Uncharacterized protein n=1 Tax=Allofranklinella schreckenbergeri TaxID=1076744 RepID=A0A3M6R1D8_9BURK|nr:hypothetical protein EBQ24_07755 [Allofranklinella schreckenbergeri]
MHQWRFYLDAHFLQVGQGGIPRGQGNAAILWSLHDGIGAAKSGKSGVTPGSMAPIEGLHLIGNAANMQRLLIGKFRYVQIAHYVGAENWRRGISIAAVCWIIFAAAATGADQSCKSCGNQKAALHGYFPRDIS